MSKKIFEMASEMQDLLGKSGLEAVEQMRAVEILAAAMCCRMDSQAASLIMVAGFHKHIRQIVEMHYEDEPTVPGK